MDPLGKPVMRKAPRASAVVPMLVSAMNTCTVAPVNVAVVAASITVPDSSGPWFARCKNCKAHNRSEKGTSGLTCDELTRSSDHNWSVRGEVFRRDVHKEVNGYCTKRSTTGKFVLGSMPENYVLHVGEPERTTVDRNENAAQDDRMVVHHKEGFVLQLPVCMLEHTDRDLVIGHAAHFQPIALSFTFIP